jgi:hypothetical protein
MFVAGFKLLQRFLEVDHVLLYEVVFLVELVIVSVREAEPCVKGGGVGDAHWDWCMSLTDANRRTD